MFTDWPGVYGISVTFVDVLSLNPSLYLCVLGARFLPSKSNLGNLKRP